MLQSAALISKRANLQLGPERQLIRRRFSRTLEMRCLWPVIAAAAVLVCITSAFPQVQSVSRTARGQCGWATSIDPAGVTACGFCGRRCFSLLRSEVGRPGEAPEREFDLVALTRVIFGASRGCAEVIDGSPLKSRGDINLI